MRLTETDRTQALALILVLSIIGSLYFNKLYKPNSIKANQIKEELSQIRKQFRELNRDLPDLTLVQEKLNQIQKERNLQNAQLVQLEKNLCTNLEVPLLLKCLTQEANEADIDIVSIQPKMLPQNKEGDRPYESLVLELQFIADWSNLIEYIHYLEYLNKFLRITDISIKKDEGSGLLHTQLTLSMLFSAKERQTPMPIFASAKLPLLLGKDSRDPFVSSIILSGPRIPAQMKKESAKLNLTGIIYKGRTKVAIIGDHILKIGDEFDGKRVLEILPNEVILATGEGREHLKLQKEKG